MQVDPACTFPFPFADGARTWVHFDAISDLSNSCEVFCAEIRDENRKANLARSLIFDSTNVKECIFNVFLIEAHQKQEVNKSYKNLLVEKGFAE